MNAGDDGRARIVATAERLFVEHGFSRVTMDEIASALGMSKKTLYRHFQSKEELCSAAVDTLFSELDEALQRIVEDHSLPFEQRLAQYFSEISVAFEKARGPLLRDLMRDAPDLYQRVVTERKEIVKRRTRALFKDGMRDGALRNDVPDRFIVALIMVISEHLIHPDRLAELQMSPRQAFERSISVILDGLRARAG